MHFLVALAPKLHVQLEFLLGSKIDLASPSREVCLAITISPNMSKSPALGPRHSVRCHIDNGKGSWTAGGTSKLYAGPVAIGRVDRMLFAQCDARNVPQPHTQITALQQHRHSDSARKGGAGHRARREAKNKSREPPPPLPFPP